MSEDNAVSNQLSQVLSELKEQRVLVTNLQEEVRGNTLNTLSEVKKLKTDKDIQWRFKGNRVQFDFNEELADVLKQIGWGLENSKLDYCEDLIKEGLDKIRKRNKLIRIADTSEGGWDTVKNYESNPVASDSEDEAKINRAENRAIKKKKATRGKAPSSFTVGENSRRYSPYPSPSTLPRQYSGVNKGRLFRGFGSIATATFPGSFSSVQAPTFTPGCCYSCGEFTHFRRDCPYLRPAANQQATTSGTK